MTDAEQQDAGLPAGGADPKPEAPDAPAAPDAPESQASQEPVKTDDTAPASEPAATAAPKAEPAPTESTKEGAPPKSKRRRKKRSPGGAPRPARPHPAGAERHSQRGFVEDRIDRDAEHLAREARTVASSRIRPLGILTQEVRRLVASGDPRDAREARRALVLMKSRMAYLAGREHGRERSALVKVREFIFNGVDVVVRNHDAPDPAQLRNFLDQVEAFIGYHRFHADDRRRD